METNSHPEAAVSNVKQGGCSPRKRKDTTPRVNPQLAVELVYQELKRVDVYTKRIEDATARKEQIDGKSLQSADNRLKNLLAAHERQRHRIQPRRSVSRLLHALVLVSPVLPQAVAVPLAVCHCFSVGFTVPA